MRAVYVMMHPNHRPAVLEQTLAALRAAGMEPSVECALLPMLSDASQTPVGPDGAEGVLCIGGDGTLLRACQTAASSGLPLLGVNVGHLGFLAEVELDQLDEACRRLAADEYAVERRMMLRARYRGHEHLALNDVVLSRGGYARLVTVDALVGDDLIGRYTADGVIVASPTGSTGYSLSAGGPIISPELECLLLAPICAHSLQHRPVVVSAQREIALQLQGDETRRVQLSIDGQTVSQLAPDERVIVSRSERTVGFVRFAPQNFFHLISRKLSEWSR